MTALFVKNMVCDRCIMVISNELSKLGIEIEHIKLGEVTLTNHPSAEDRAIINERLALLGFEIIDDKKGRIIEKIKNIIINQVHHQPEEQKTILSELLSNTLHHDYNYLSNLFSENEGTTIEKFYITQRIEKVKELLAYDEMSLSEIALQLNYSSVAYLSNQFKKITGFTPSGFKQSNKGERKPLDKL